MMKFFYMHENKIYLTVYKHNIYNIVNSMRVFDKKYHYIKFQSFANKLNVNFTVYAIYLGKFQMDSTYS